MKEHAHSASVARAAPQIAITMTGKSVGKENNIAKGSDDGDNDGSGILTQSFRHGVALSPATGNNRHKRHLRIIFNKT